MLSLQAIGDRLYGRLALLSRLRSLLFRLACLFRLKLGQVALGPLLDLAFLFLAYL